MFTIGFLLAYVCFADAKGLGLLDDAQFDPRVLEELPGLVQKAKGYTTVDLIKAEGYPVEDHYAVAPDGYILNLHRIPRGKSGRRSNKVAFLQHGILASSSDWVIAGPGKGLGYMLADEGYDVWMGNARGNMYSRNHTSLDPNKDSGFWDFSWHEIGVVDVPAMIDYVLEHTGADGVYYAGHSQGTTVFFVMAALRPEYNRKVKAQASLAPVAYVRHVTSPLLKLLAFWEKPIEMLFDLIGPHEFLPRSGFVSRLSQRLCKPGSRLSMFICENMLFVVAGFNPFQTNTTLLPNVMAHAPAGSSTRQLLHFGQEMKSGYFRQYDFGRKDNLRRYRSRYPPRYRLNRITTPVHLIYSRNDWLATEVDVAKLCSELGSSCRGSFLISDYVFNHLDFTYGIHAPKLVNTKVISIFARY